MTVTVRTLTLIGRDGCHLCDDARAIITSVLAELDDSEEKRVLVEVDIDSDADALRAYSEQIPVLLIDGKVHNFWRIDRDRLLAALS